MINSASHYVMVCTLVVLAVFSLPRGQEQQNTPPPGLQTSQSLINRGNQFYSAGQYKRAVILYKKSIQRGGDPATLSFNLGNCYYRLGDLAKSAAAYKKALRLSSGENRPALMNLASVMFRLGEYGRSIALYRRLLKEDADFLSGWLYLADAYIQTGDLISAQLTLEKAHRQEPNDVSILYQLAEVHVSLKEYAAAIELIEKAYVRNPEEIDFLFYMGDLHRFQKQFANAATAYRKGLALQPENIDVLYKLADVLEKDNKKFLAMDYLNRALIIKPGFTDAAIFLGNLAFDLKMWNRSENAYLQALSSENKEGVEGIRNIAFEYNKMGRQDEALKLIDKALSLAPKNSDLESDKILYQNQNL